MSRRLFAFWPIAKKTTLLHAHEIKALFGADCGGGDGGGGAVVL